MGRVLLALVSTLFLVTQVIAGAWTPNNFLYKPAIGARGIDEKAKFDSGLNRVDARLANEKWLNDSLYSGDLGTAITAIGSAKTVLSIPAGNWPITANLTVPANLTLKLARGALLTIATGKTLTINGTLDAGLYQIFSCSGTGKVVFGVGAVENSYPEWWGAYSDGTNATATSAAIQAAINAGHALVYLSANGNYNIGTTGLIFAYGYGLSMKMALGSRITYIGTEAAITIDTSINAMNGLRLDLFNIYSSGKYAIKFAGGTSGGPWDHYCQSFSIKANEIYNFTEAAIYADCILEGGDIDIMVIQTSNPYTAWGVYFTPGITGTTWEDVRIKYIHAGKRAAYLPPNWNYGRLDVDVDSTTQDNTYNKIELAGNYNQIIIRASAPGNLEYTFSRPIWLKPEAFGNTIIASPYTLKGIVDDTTVGNNTYGGNAGTEDLMLNGSFQSFNDSGPVDWNANGNCTTARETTEFRFGKCGVKVIAMGGYACIYQPIPSSLIGKTVTFSGWFKAPSTNSKGAGISIAGGTASGMSNVVIPKDNSWHFLSATGVIPNPADNVYIYANITDSDGIGDVVYAGGCSFIVGSSPVFPDSNPGTHLYSKITWNPSNIADGAMTSTMVTCVGAAVGDPVMVGFSQPVPAGAMLSGSVTALDTVTVTLFNKTGTPLDLASGTVKVVVRKKEN